MAQTIRRNAPPTALNSEVLAGLMRLLAKTFHGQVSLVTQNYRVVQIERRENFNPDDLLTPDLGLSAEHFRVEAVRDKIAQALKGLEYGQVVLVIKKGRLAQIERLQKERYADLQGLAGDGI
ncbi:MAG: YezD family protein [Deltaproteobacteria bacterium]|jgi:hypothetical protein|nr:YezD family protein [Deltaproteobacteria bacterium]